MDPRPGASARLAPSDPARTSGGGTVRGEVWDFGHIRGILSNCRINRQTVSLKVICETCKYKVGALGVSNPLKRGETNGTDRALPKPDISCATGHARLLQVGDLRYRD